MSGHADSSGSTEFNEKLSKARAQAIQAALVEAGIDPKLIELAARDVELAASADASDSDLALERKVVIRVR